MISPIGTRVGRRMVPQCVAAERRGKSTPRCESNPLILLDQRELIPDAVEPGGQHRDSGPGVEPAAQVGVACRDGDTCAPSSSRPTSEEERQFGYEATRRGVEIMVKFLGKSTLVDETSSGPTSGPFSNRDWSQRATNNA